MIYSWRHIFFKVTENFFVEADTKKHRYTLAKASHATLVKITD